MSDLFDDIFFGLFMALLAMSGAVGYLPMRGWRWRVPTHFKTGERITFSYLYCLFTHWGLKTDGWCPNCGFYKAELLKKPNNNQALEGNK